MNTRSRALSKQKPAMDQGMISRSTTETHSQRILAELHALNLRYVELLSCGCFREIPTHVANELSELSSEAMQRAAECPFSLFDIAFDDLHIWQAMFDRIAERRQSWESQTNQRADFVKGVLMLLWHSLNSSEAGQTQVRLLLGLQPQIAVRIAKLSVPALLDLAHEAADLIRPRWSNHPRFWSELIQGASEHQLHKAQAVRVLGRQLLAADALRAASGAGIPHIGNNARRHR